MAEELPVLANRPVASSRPSSAYTISITRPHLVMTRLAGNAGAQSVGDYLSDLQSPARDVSSTHGVLHAIHSTTNDEWVL